MALEIRQQLKLGQQLVMTPQLQQAIKLLQLSRMELLDVVRAELEENPVLEEGQENDDEQAELGNLSSEVEGAVEVAAEEVREVVGDRENFGDIDWHTYLESYSLGGTTTDNYEDDDDRPSYENLLTRKPSLQDHLLWQLKLSTIEGRDRLIAEEIIGNLDEDGYLQASAEEIAVQTESPVSRVERVLRTLQEFDPPGVAARTLQECLLRQVEQLGMQGT
jgi:RNA polymerase sigma-54 factor